MTTAAEPKIVVTTSPIRVSRPEYIIVAGERTTTLPQRIKLTFFLQDLTYEYNSKRMQSKNLMCLRNVLKVFLSHE